MQYKVEVLKSMIENRTRNIEMFMKYESEQSQMKMFDMIKERRDLCALIENDGVLDDNMVRPDIMLYEAQAGADTSWWTKGT